MQSYEINNKVVQNCQRWTNMDKSSRNAEWIDGRLLWDTRPASGAILHPVGTHQGALHGDGADVLLDRQCCDDLGSCLQRLLHNNRPDRLLLWSWRCHHRYNPWSLRFQAHSQSGLPICCLCLYWSKWSDYPANKRLTRR